MQPHGSGRYVFAVPFDRQPQAALCAAGSSFGVIAAAIRSILDGVGFPLEEAFSCYSRQGEL